jgi:hypothetical protein
MPCLRNWLLPAADLERLIDYARSDDRKFAGQQTMALPPNPDVSSVTELLEAIQALSCKKHSQIRHWFRGQSDASWGLSPVVYRESFHAEDEDARLLKERHITQDFIIMSAGLLTGTKSEAELYFLQQHYRMPTRLLDWTTSPLAALYFAAESQQEKDAAVFVLDAYTLGPGQGGKWKDGRPFEGCATSRNPIFENALHPIFRWQNKSHFPDFILPVRPDQFDRRISLQRGCFTFHPPGKGTLDKNVSKNLKIFKIPAAEKACIIADLALLAVDKFSIYGDLGHLAEYLKYIHKCE